MVISVVGLVAIISAICIMVYKSDLNVQDFEITLFGVFKIKIKTNGKRSK